MGYQLLIPIYVLNVVNAKGAVLWGRWLMPDKKNDLQICKSFFYVRPGGIEPPSEEPESPILSIKLRAHKNQG